MPARSINNCFGDGSPSWNVEFPAGRLTAAEIITYFPHWLKSVDVIDRFVRNGGGPAILVDMVNEFRDLPGGVDMQRNSILIMMQNAMRNFGLAKWKAGKHAELVDMSAWDSLNLFVGGFRVPRITHPKTGKAAAFNAPAAPVEFRDLALHVKQHPSGPDALDLTRCIAWACSHPHQSWLFPQDFTKLVNHLGGERDVTLGNSDSEAFTRRSSSQVTPLTTLAALAPPQPQPTDRTQAVNRRNKKNTVRKARSQDTQPQPLTRSPARSPSRQRKQSGQVLASPGVSRVRINEKVSCNSNIQPRNMRLTRSQAAKRSAMSGQTSSQNEFLSTSVPADAFIGGIRKSNRLRRNLFDIPPTTSDTGEADSLYDNYVDGEYTPGSKRKRHDDEASYEPAIQDTVESSEEEHAKILEPSTSPTTTTRSRDRPAAKKARHEIKVLADAQNTVISRKPHQPSNIDPALTAAAREFDKRAPVFVKPPVLNPDRLTVDRHNVLVFAAEGAKDVWASALSSTRFNGPRTSAPWRELYRLTPPANEDASDWAENIRWAKEQHQLFGSKTWTEYDYHLEMITEHRRTTQWVSETAIQFGKF